MRCNELGSGGGGRWGGIARLPRKRIGMVQQGCIAVAMDHSGIGEQAMRMAQRHAYVAIVRSEQEILRLSEEWESCVILLGWCDGTGESTERLIRKVRQARLALPIVVLSDAVRGRQMTEARRLQLAMAGADDCINLSAAHAESVFGISVGIRLRRILPEAIMRLFEFPPLLREREGNWQAMQGLTAATWIARNAGRRRSVRDITRWFGISERCLLDWLQALGLSTTRDVCGLFRLLRIVTEARDHPASAAKLARNTGFRDETALMHFIRRYADCTLRELRTMSMAQVVSERIRSRLVRRASCACGKQHGGRRCP